MPELFAIMVHASEQMEVYLNVQGLGYAYQ